MRDHQKLTATFLAAVVGLVLCGVPELVHAQEPSANPSATQTQQTGTTIDPSKGPLQPIPTQNRPEMPNAPQPGQNNDLTNAPQPATPAPQPKAAPQQEPLGTATAEGVSTVGGGASRPAGAAIAPAKQSQKRTLLLKIGAIAAAGAAGGIIYGLSKGTPSKP